MPERGIIRSLIYARQRADFRGMLFGTISPTDIDGLVEFEDRVFVFMETKHGDADLPTGQRLALERMCDRIQKSGAEGMILVAHNTAADVSPTYELGGLPVIRYRYRNEWKETTGRRTVTEWIARFASAKLGRQIAPSELRIERPQLSLLAPQGGFSSVADIDVPF